MVPSRRKGIGILALKSILSTYCTLAVTERIKFINRVLASISGITWRLQSRTLDEKCRYNAHKQTPGVMSNYSL